MNLRDLQYVCAVADEAHFGRAAEACHVSQPTLSSQIRKLEDELGVELFERSPRSVRLTPAGDVIVPIAREVLASAREIELAAQRFRDPEAGVIRVGLIPTIAPYLIPLAVGPLRERFPDLTVAFVEDTTESLLLRLDRGEIDAAVLATEHDELPLVDLPLYREPFWFVLPAGHPKGRRRTLDPHELAPEELLLLQDGHCLRDQALEVCGLARGWRDADTTATSLETLVNLVSAGHGVTLVPALALDVAKRARGVAICRTRPGPGGAERLVRLVHRHRFPRAGLLQEIGAVVARTVPRGVVKPPV